MECDECGLLYTRERDDNYENFYTEGLKYHKDRVNETPYMERFDHDKKVGALRLHKYRGLVRILDVGCANGGFLAQALEEGYDVMGLEVNPTMAAYAAERLGCPVHTSWETIDKTFDIITYHDVLEHVEYPAAELEKAGTYLRTGGLLIVDLPDSDDPSRALKQADWHHMKPFEHLYFFNEKAFRRLVEDDLKMFDVIHIDRPIQGKIVFYLNKREYPRYKMTDWKWEVRYGQKS